MLRITMLAAAAATLLSVDLAVGAIRTGSRSPAFAEKSRARQSDRGNPNPGIAPINSTPNGRTYGDWGNAFFQWLFAIPDDRNPGSDPDGRFCAEGQSGPVWFLSSTYGFSTERSCAIPSGRAIFMVVGAGIAGAGLYDCDPSVPGTPCDVATLRGTAAAIIDASSQFQSVTIDGTPVVNIQQYRAASPIPFSLTYPENSVVGLPAGMYYPNVMDGYWLMLHPMPTGTHEIRLRVVSPPASLDFEVVWHITVE